MMKVDRLETHDRLLHLKQDQSLNLSTGAQDCLKRNSLSLALQEHSPYIYIFAHPRTADDGVTKRMIWQARLSRPKMEPNSYLFKAQSKTDVIEVCWLLPPKEMWKEYDKGKVTENDIVLWSIAQYKTNREKMERPDPEDCSQDRFDSIYRAIRREFREEEEREKMFLRPTSDYRIVKPKISGVYPSSSSRGILLP